MTDRERLLALSDDALLRECEVDRYRASGPGGQKRNKTESAVRVRHLPTGLAGHSADSRSQHENRVRAVRRLREKLALELRNPVTVDGYAPPPELAALVARGGAATRRERDGAAHLLALAQLLDLFTAVDFAVAPVGSALGITTGAASKLLLSDERAAQQVNQLRRQHQLRPLG